jgi:chromosome segregation ATPase
MTENERLRGRLQLAEEQSSLHEQEASEAKMELLKSVETHRTYEGSLRAQLSQIESERAAQQEGQEKQLRLLESQVSLSQSEASRQHSAADKIQSELMSAIHTMETTSKEAADTERAQQQREAVLRSQVGGLQEDCGRLQEKLKTLYDLCENQQQALKEHNNMVARAREEKQAMLAERTQSEQTMAQLRSGASQQSENLQVRTKFRGKLALKDEMVFS